MKLHSMVKILCILLVALSLSEGARRNKKQELQEIEKREKELAVLQAFLGNARDSLENEIKQRWVKKQQYVEQRELDKQRMESLRELEQVKYNDLSRIKEEIFALEKRSSEEDTKVDQLTEQWKAVATGFEEVFDKEEKIIVESFPLDMEKDKKALSAIRKEYNARKKSDVILPKLTVYYTNKLERAFNVKNERRTILTDKGGVHDANVLRFGNIFAYALNNSSQAFLIRQTGELGAGKFKVEEATAPQLVSHIQNDIVSYISKGSIDSTVHFDIMQNSNSDKIIAGEEVDNSALLKEWFRAGGFIMYPLCGLLIWGILMIIYKLLQFSIKHKNSRRMAHNVMECLKDNKKKEAQEYAEKHRGVVGKIVTACLIHSEWNRQAAEKAVKEILVEEIPQLEKFLATLSVIAGAAPLLGLLGTVTGMIHLFTVITQYGTSDPKILAGGISEALITTQAGLAIAIPMLLMHNFLKNRSVFIQNEMQKYAIRLLNKLWPEAS